jgi:hypothetical protein
MFIASSTYSVVLVLQKGFGLDADDGSKVKGGRRLTTTVGV